MQLQGQDCVSVRLEDLDDLNGFEIEKTTRRR